MIRVDYTMCLKNLKITNNLHEIIEVYKQFKHIVFENWCGLHYQEANEQKNMFWEQIKRCAESIDPTDSVRVCIGAVILAKYSQSFRDNCSNLLQNIRPQRENAFSVFISIQIAKYAKRFRTSLQFTQSYIQVILESLKLNGTRSFDKHYLNILYYLTVYATKEIDKCTLLFYEALVNAFENPSDEIRIYAMRTLNNYFRLTVQKQFPHNLHKQSTQFISQKNHGRLLILVSLIDFFPEYFFDSYYKRIYMNMINTMKKDSKMIYSCNLIQIALASIFPDDFRNNVEIILKNNWPDDKSKFTSDFVYPISFTLQKFPQAFLSKDNNFLQQLLDLIKNLISKVEDRAITDIGSSLLLNFMIKLPTEFENYAERISRILLTTDYPVSFIPTFKQIIHQSKTVWRFILREIETLLTILFEDKREEKLMIFAELISSLPSIPETAATKNKDRLLFLLNHSNINVRKRVPPALLAISKQFPYKISAHIGTSLISSALIEESIRMRLNILNSFTEPYPSYLAYPTNLEYFSILVNDESFKVRKSVLTILCGVVSKNPAMIYPIFRKVLLDILFLLGSSKSLRMKSEAILCLPIIFSSTAPILPIYVPLFMPIAIQQLKTNLSVASNEIDNPENFKTVPFYQHPMMSYNSISSFSKNPYERQLSNSSEFKPTIIGFNNSSMSTIKESVAQRIISEEQMSFFERMFTTTITEHSILTIGCICEKCFPLIRPFIKDITRILLETIGRAAHKSILLASIDTLGKIIDQIGPIEAANITDLNTTLLKLGSRIISSKVFTAIFRTLGKIGPISPQNSLNIEISEVKAPENVDLSVSRDDYFVRAVVTSLFFVLDDKSESDLHSDAHLALSRTFSTCRKSVNSQRLFKSYVVRLLTTIRALAPDDRSKYFQYIATILRCPVEWLQPFSLHFFQLIEDLWETENNVDVLDIIPKLASRLKDEFSHYMPRVVSHLLDALISSCSSSTSSDNYKPQLILKTICELSKFAAQFVFIIINQICVLLTEKHFKLSEQIQITAIDSLRSLIQTFNCIPYSSIIMRACFSLTRKNAALKERIMQVIYSLAVSMESKFLIYSDAIKENELMTPEMEQILNFSALKKRKKLTDFPFIIVDKKDPEMFEWKPNTAIDESDLIKIISINTEGITDEAWKSWIRTFIKAFITHSPVPAIQSCMPIAEKSPLFNRKIFNPAFLSCWATVKNDSRRSIQMVISEALSYYMTIPSSVITALIGLIEFTDRAGMPIEGNYFIRTKSAMNAGKRTFALYCAQRDFDSTHESARNIENLIQIYSQLGMFDEVHGMEKISHNVIIHDEKLDQKLNKLELSEQWTSITGYFNSFLSKAEPEKKRSNVTFAHAFYHLKDWKDFDISIAQDKDSPNSIIMNCLRGLYLKKDISALIEEGFIQLGKQGGPLFLHGFTTVAPYIVNAQQLVEIQEYFTNKKIDHWEKRLVPIKCTFNTIRPLLHMRMDILQNEGPLKTFPHQLSFLKFARKANEWKAFEQFYDIHFTSSDIDKINRLQKLQLDYEYLHLLRKKVTIEASFNFLDSCLTTPPKNNGEKEIFSKFYFKKAKWIARLINEDVAEQMSQVIDLCNKSLEMRPNHYSVKNLWSWANMHLFTNCSNQNMFFVLDEEEKTNKINVSSQILAQAAINAITGFASCLKLDFKDTFFDLLQMTSILFRSTNIPGVFDASIDAVKSVQLKRFIKVIPQLLVYQYTHSIPHQKLVYEILSKLLTQYPNSVIFPLLFVNNTRKNTNIGVSDMLKSFAMNHSEFYDSAVNVLQGLQKACITLPEYFTEALDKIKSKIKKRDIASLETLIPLLIYKLKKALNSASSPYEAAFVKKHRNALTSVLLTIEKYMRDHNLPEFITLSNKWGEYFNIIKTEVLSEVQLSLKFVAPELENFDNVGEMSSMIALMSSSSSVKSPSFQQTEEKATESTKTNNENLKKTDKNEEEKANKKTSKSPLLNFPIEHVLSPANYDSENSITRRQFEEKAKKRENFYNIKNDDHQNDEIKKNGSSRTQDNLKNILNIKTQIVESPESDDSFIPKKNENDKENKKTVQTSPQFMKNAKQVMSPILTDSDNSLVGNKLTKEKPLLLSKTKKVNSTTSSDDSFTVRNKQKAARRNNFYHTNDTENYDKKPSPISTQFMKNAKQVMSPILTDSDGSLAGSKVSLSSHLTKEKPMDLSHIKNENSSSSDDSFAAKNKQKKQKRNNFYHTNENEESNNDQLKVSSQFIKNAELVQSPILSDSENSLIGNKVNSSFLSQNSNENENNNQKLKKEKPIDLSNIKDESISSSDDSFVAKNKQKMQRRKNFYYTNDKENENEESNSDQLKVSSQFITNAELIQSPILSDSENSLVGNKVNSSFLSQNENNNQKLKKEKPIDLSNIKDESISSSDDSFVAKNKQKMQRRKNFYRTNDKENENEESNSDQLKVSSQFITNTELIQSPILSDSENSFVGNKTSTSNSSLNCDNKEKMQKEIKKGSIFSSNDNSTTKNKQKISITNFYHINKNDEDDEIESYTEKQKSQESSQFMKNAKRVMSPILTDSENSFVGNKVNSSFLLQNENNNNNQKLKKEKPIDLSHISSSDDSFAAKNKQKIEKRKNFYHTNDNDDQKTTNQFLKTSKTVMSPQSDSDESLVSNNEEQIRKQNLYMKQEENINILQQTKNTTQTTPKKQFTQSKTSKIDKSDEKNQKETPKNQNKKSSSIFESLSSPHVVNIKSATATVSKLRTDRRRQCQLAVFNTFDPDKPTITIKKFNDLVKIKLSKHRPRKIIITGSDGKLYKFLLKGHEDLRVDQRMMQYFELMNSIAPASIPQIIITGVTPLSPNVGLIQWVPQCDLMKSLIIEFRKIGINVENCENNNNNNVDDDDDENDENDDNRKKFDGKIFKEIKMMKKMTTPWINSLMPIQRLEAIKEIMKETSPNDLRDMMWLKAQDAESWVRHTLNFTKTSAVMSIVGYIIGLGDRHPANIMIQRSSGRVIHIDFGDYFEVAKERKYLSEKIPFRLTRMMIATFGPCGIEGSFRKKCEETVQTIREHREAVMSILEIFIREPCSSGAFFYNTNKMESKIDVISGSVGIDQYMKNGNNKFHDKLLKNMSTISKKIDGLDFDNVVPLSISQQVDKLIDSATDLYNLAYLYHGWNPLW